MKNIYFLIITMLYFSSMNSQEIDHNKIEKIGSILCQVLEQNENKNIEERVNDCGYALSEGLKAIKSDSIRELYAAKSDTYLQKNCKSYIELMIEVNPDTSISLSNFKDFEVMKSKSLNIDDSLMSMRFSYLSYVGDIIEVYFEKQLFN